MIKDVIVHNRLLAGDETIWFCRVCIRFRKCFLFVATHAAPPPGFCRGLEACKGGDRPDANAERLLRKCWRNQGDASALTSHRIHLDGPTPRDLSTNATCQLEKTEKLRGKTDYRRSNTGRRSKQHHSPAKLPLARTCAKSLR